MTVDEALALIVSYEALLRYPVSPFSAEGVSAVTKLRAALPADVVGELDALREHVAVVKPVRDYEAPLLGDLLQAALDGAHLKVSYDSVRSGVSERMIFPFGVYASQGFWYGACHDYKRKINVSLRADRFLSVERLEGPTTPPRPPHIPLKNWTREVRNDFGEKLRLRVWVSERGGEELRANFPARQDRGGSGWRHRSGSRDTALGDRLLRLPPVERGDRRPGRGTSRASLGHA